MLAAPLRIIAEPSQAPLVVPLHPAPDRLLVHQQNLSHLPIAIPLMHKDQRMIPLALMPLHSHVLVAPHRFLVIRLTQHRYPWTPFPVICPLAYPLLGKSTSCCSVSID